MEKEKRNHRQEHLRKLKENTFLLEEIEQLKKELKSAQEYKIPAQPQLWSVSDVTWRPSLPTRV